MEIADREDMGVPRDVRPDKPAVNLDLPWHEFIQSEFTVEKICDMCGGGPAAAIHQKPIDPMDRIADALEQFAEVFADIREELYNIERAIRGYDRE